jgi:hypothetical protein
VRRGNRELLTGNRELLTGNREQGTLNWEQGTGNREQGKETIFCNNVQNYGLFLMYSKLSEIFWT